MAGGAPLPDGVRAFVRAGGVPGRAEPAHVADAAGPRRGAAAREPPGAGGGVRGDAGRAEQRAGGAGHGPLRHAVPAVAVWPGHQRHAGHVGRGAVDHTPHVDGGGLLARRQVLSHTAARGDPQAGPGPAPAAVGGMHADGDLPPGGGAWPGGAVLHHWEPRRAGEPGESVPRGGEQRDARWQVCEQPGGGVYDRLLR